MGYSKVYISKGRQAFTADRPFIIKRCFYRVILFSTGAQPHLPETRFQMEHDALNNFAVQSRLRPTPSSGRGGHAQRRVHFGDVGKKVYKRTPLKIATGERLL